MWIQDPITSFGVTVPILKMQSTNFNPVPLVTLLITFFVSAVFGQTSVDDVQEQAGTLNSNQSEK